MRALAFALTAAVLAAGVSVAQEKKADPPKPAAEVKLPDGVTRGVTVEGLTEYKLKNGLPEEAPVMRAVLPVSPFMGR